MADTQRSLADILTLLADNVTGDISAQDIRDAVVSMQPHYARCDMQGNALTTTPSPGAGDFVKVAGATSFIGSALFDDGATPTPNRLRYIGASPRHVHAACSFTLTSTSTNKTFGLKAVHYDDSAASLIELDSSLVRLKLAGGGAVESSALHFDVMLDTNDYIEIHATSYTTAEPLKVEDMYFFVLTMIV